jgi:uncharacterized protein (DUF2236 family)
VHGDDIGRGGNVDDGREVDERVVGDSSGLMAGLAAVVLTVAMPMV